MKLIEQLLEQHDHYDLGDGWTISKREKRWHIYYRAKHVDCWDAEHGIAPLPETLSSFHNAVTAASCAQSIKLLADWARQPVGGI